MFAARRNQSRSNDSHARLTAAISRVYYDKRNKKDKEIYLLKMKHKSFLLQKEIRLHRTADVRAQINVNFLSAQKYGRNQFQRIISEK